MKTDLKILPAGDSAVVAEFGNTIDPLINDQVQALAARIHSAGLAGIRELIPSFRSLLILYDPGLLSYQKLTETLKQFSFSPFRQRAERKTDSSHPLLLRFPFRF